MAPFSGRTGVLRISFLNHFNVLSPAAVMLCGDVPAKLTSVDIPSDDSNDELMLTSIAQLLA